MKLYIPDLKYNNVNANYIKNFFYKNITVKTIISEEGIFQIKNQAVEKIKIIDKPVINIKINNIEGLLDESKEVSIEKVTHIPKHHFFSQWNYSYYSINPNSFVSFVIGETVNNNGYAYFDIKSNGLTESIKEEIYTFLIKLKFC